jgi:tmRNA-binding protein
MQILNLKLIIMNKARFSNDINIRNRQATFDYEIIDKLAIAILMKPNFL